jgi:hypothetical protein
MYPNSGPQRHGLVLIQLLVVLAVFTGSVVSLCDPNCRLRTIELTIDGLCVGAIVAGVRLVCIMKRRCPQPAFAWWCVARVLFGIELKYGLIGGYLLGITRAAIACLGN